MKIFAPLMHPIVAVAHRLGADRAGRIGAARGLGEAEEAALLAAQHREEVALLLVLVGLVELRQAGAAERAEAGRVEPGAVLGGLDRDQSLGHDVDVGPAELRRDAEAVEAHGLRLGAEPRVILRRQLARRRDRASPPAAQISSRTKRRTCSTISACSSLGSRSIGAPPKAGLSRPRRQPLGGIAGRQRAVSRRGAAISSSS